MYTNEYDLSNSDIFKVTLDAVLCNRSRTQLVFFSVLVLGVLHGFSLILSLGTFHWYLVSRSGQTCM